jgi:condensin complex subunit 3
LKSYLWLTLRLQSLAEENLTLFIHFFTKGHAALQITALHILTDILTQHGAHVLDSNPALLKVYIKALKSGSKTPEVQATATVSVCKLMLGRVIQNSEASNELLKTLIIAYFDPVNQGNQGVRQALSYFLPVYSSSRQENQDRMRSVAMDAMHSLFNMHEALDDDEDAEMVSLGTIGAHLVDWTDPRKCYVPGDNLALVDESSKKAVNGDVHLDLARDILERLNTNITSKIRPNPSPMNITPTNHRYRRKENPSTSPCKATHFPRFH